MFKRMILTAACAAFTISVAHADFAPSQVEHRYDSVINSSDPYYRLPFTIPGVAFPASFWCPLTGAGFTGEQPLARNGVYGGGKLLSADGQSCLIQMPKDMAAGMYEVRLSFVMGGVTYDQTYRFIYTDNEPISALQMKSEYDRDDFISMEFYKTYGRLVPLDLPEGLYAGGQGGQYLGVSGRLYPEKTTDYSFEVLDLDSDQTLTVNFKVNVAEQPKPEESETPVACAPKMTAPADGSKFVFRYPIKSAACS